jgi:hypothetical protein
MTITYNGSLALSAAVPGANAAAIAGQAGISTALPDLQARIGAMADFTPVAVDFTATINQLLATIAALQAAIAQGITPPSIAAQIAEVSAQISNLQTDLGAVSANLGIVVAFLNLLTSAGVHSYGYAGAANTFGGEFSTELGSGLPGGGGGSETINGVALLTNVPSTWAAIQSMFGV